MSSPQRPVVVVGMHRSGTSLTASILGSSGLHLGERLAPAGHGNAAGHFEDLEFVYLHRAALLALDHHPDGWAEVVLEDMPDVLEAKARALIAARSARPLWGWKDPRTTLFLPFWERLLPEAWFVFVYRSPWQVIDSLQRRGDDRFRTDPAASARLWSHYNTVILDALSRVGERGVLFNLEDIAAQPRAFVEQVGRAFGLRLPPPREVFQPDLLRCGEGLADRRASSPDVLSREIELLGRLDEAAQRLTSCPSAGNCAEEPAQAPAACEAPRPADEHLQLFVPARGTYAEAASIADFLEADGQTRDHTFLVRYDGSAPLRIDTGGSVGIVEVRVLSVRARETDAVVSWSGRSLETAPLRLANAIRFSRSHRDGIRFLSLNDDPQVYVHLPERQRFRGACLVDVTVGFRALTEEPMQRAAGALLRELRAATAANALFRAQLADADPRQDETTVEGLHRRLAEASHRLTWSEGATAEHRERVATWRRARSAAKALLRRLASTSFVSDSDLTCLAGTPFFDADFYLASNPDVQAAQLEPRRHYLSRGAAERRDPSPWFTTAFYLAKYPDVTAAGVNPLVHYVTHGAREGRVPNPWCQPTTPGSLGGPQAFG